jgi:vesicle-associated membrane protein 7
MTSKHLLYKLLQSTICPHHCILLLCSSRHIFHYIVDNGITFLCMTEESTKRRVAFSFLDEVKSQWRQEYAGVEQTALAFSLNDRFSPVLHHQMV